MKYLIGVVFVAVLVGVGYYLIAPAFQKIAVDDALDADIAALLEGDAMESDDMSVMESEAGGDAVEKEPETLPQGDGSEVNEGGVPDETVMESIPTQENAGPAVLKTGSFTSVAHEGTGAVSLIRLADGSAIVRFENLDVLNGPDLRVLLSPNSTVEGTEDLGEYIELGKLKGNLGNQNYVVPAGVDLDAVKSAVIYCAPFRVVFNAAPLE